MLIFVSAIFGNYNSFLEKFQYNPANFQKILRQEIDAKKARASIFISENLIRTPGLDWQVISFFE